MSGPGKHDLSAREAIDALLEQLEALESQSTFAWLQLSDASAPYDPPEEFRRAHYPEDADPRASAGTGPG